MTGVRTMMRVVSFQLMRNRKMRLPRNWSMFLRSMEMLSDAALCTTAISLVNLEINYPLLF